MINIFLSIQIEQANYYTLGWPYPKREVYPSDAELAEYLAQLRNSYDTDIQGWIINHPNNFN